VAIASHFLKFQAQAAINTLISSPTCPLSRFLESLKSDLRCPIIGPTGHGINTISNDDFFQRINKDKASELNIWIGDEHGTPNGSMLLIDFFS
jgi:hypothetical protein